MTTEQTELLIVDLSNEPNAGISKEWQPLVRSKERSAGSAASDHAIHEATSLEAALSHANLALGKAEQAASEARLHLRAIQESNSWRITRPLRLAKTAYVEVEHWLRPRRRFLPELVPASDILSEHHGYRSTGVDPSFLLDFGGSRPPRGWCEITIQVVTAGDRAAPKLYVDQGGGFSEGTALVLPPTCAVAGTCRVWLPPQVRALRFDPLEHVGRFRVERFEIVQLGLLWVGLRSLWVLLRRNGAAGATGELIRQIRTALALGFPGLKAALLHSSQRDEYETWHALEARERNVRRHAQFAGLSRRPLISVVMPTYNTPERWLRRAIESVLRQT